MAKNMKEAIKEANERQILKCLNRSESGKIIFKSDTHKSVLSAMKRLEDRGEIKIELDENEFSSWYIITHQLDF